MKPAILSLLAVILLVGGIGIGFALKSQPTASVKAVAQAQPPTRAELLKLVNEQRAKAGVAPLKEDKRLDWSAQAKADDEVIYNYFGHFRDGKFIGQQFIDDTGITCTLDDENLQRENYGPNTAKADVASWMTSTPHRKAILDPNYTLTGFGIDKNEIVEHFCQP